MPYSPIKSDRQRSRVYAGEWAVDRAFKDSLMTLVEFEAFISEITTSAWWKKNWAETLYRRSGLGMGGTNRFTVRVEKRKNYGTAHIQRDWSERGTGGFIIVVHPHATSRRLALHELSHAMAGLGQGHNRVFAYWYLQTVRHFEGEEAYKALKDSFKKHGVKHSLPRPKKQLTEEQKDVLRARIKFYAERHRANGAANS